jgi:hypothetical protein
MRLEIPLTTLQQRILAWLLAATPLFAVGMIVVSFVSAQISYHAHVSLLVHELVREEALVREAPDWATRLATIKKTTLWQNLFLSDAASPPGIGQQNQLLRIITKSGATVLHSSTTISHPLHGGATESDESVMFVADITELTRILYDLRTPTPLFVLRELSIHDEEGTLTAPRAMPNKLRIDLMVTGFVRPS